MARYGSVSQDSEAIREVAEDIKANAKSYKKTYEEIFTLMSEKITEAKAASSAWWGPNAKAFYDEFEKKRIDFENAYKNLSAMASNLEEQANAWDSFENS